MSKCDKCDKCADHSCGCSNKCRCEKDHHHYHHDYHGGGRAHPVMSMSASMEIVPASELVSTRAWSKDPAQNTSIGGVYIGCNMGGQDIPLAFQALAAGVANLTADVGAGTTWAQFESAYGLRKYEGDADCVFTIKPKPQAWVLSEVTPAPPEGPAVQRDCLARTWVTCESVYDTCEVTEADGLTTYTFSQTMGDGTEIEGEKLSLTIPTIIGLPNFPVKAGSADTTEYMICYSPCANGGEPFWIEKPTQPETATDAAEGLIRFVTAAEFTAGTFPAGTVLTPQQVCDKIDTAVAAAIADLNIPTVPTDIITDGDLTKVNGEVTAINGCAIAAATTGGGGTGTAMTGLEIANALCAAQADGTVTTTTGDKDFSLYCNNGSSFFSGTDNN